MSQSIKSLQDTVRYYLDMLGWQRKAFIERYIAEKFPDLDPWDPEYEEEVRKGFENLKKHLDTDIKKPKPLNAYIDFIRRQPEYLKVESVLPKNYSKGLISDSFDEGMERISKSLSEWLEK